MPETQTMPKPLVVEKIIGARMDLPFGLGSARKLQKWQDEQVTSAEKIEAVKAEAEKIAAAKAAEAEAAQAAFAEPTEEALDITDDKPEEVAATPAMSQSESEPASQEQEAPEEPPAPAEDFFGKVVGLFSQRDNEAK